MTDYQLSDAQADVLKGAVSVPADLRRELLGRYLTSHGAPALVDLFAQFIGAANSVVSNCREMAEILLITEGNVQPTQAEKINLPTLLGAMMGVAAASSVTQRGLCAGCAYRKGTPANQCLPTMSDLEYCFQEGKRFMCHERLDSAGEPVSVCAGHAQEVRRVRGKQHARESVVKFATV